MSLVHVLPGATPVLLTRLRATLTGRFASATILALVAGLVSRAFFLLSMVGASRLLSTDEFGRFALAYNTAQLAQAFALLGLGPTIQYFVARYRSTDRELASRYLVACRRLSAGAAISVALLIGVFADFIARHGYAIENAASFLVIAGPMGATLIWCEMQMAVLAALERYRDQLAVAAASGPATTLLVVGGCHIAALPGALLGLGLGLGLNAAGLTLAARRAVALAGIQMHASPDRATWREIARFAAPIFAASLFWMPTIWAGNALLARQPSGVHEVAVFAAAWQWYSMLTFFPTIAMSVAFVLMSHGAESRNVAHLHPLRSSLISLFVMGPPVAIVALASPLIMSIYGPAFQENWLTLAILAMATLTITPTLICTNTLAITGRLRSRILVNFTWSLVLIPAAYMLTSYGSAGLATAHSISHVARLIVALVLIYRYQSQAGAFPYLLRFLFKK
ncbi:oligosaccharide flippase family protein [Benzoatithermus flavus]|uniref:Oligosaccharide flippase family protein n=1 Tax=Benzoatithermus flavus TaxID=3108223 RepID=A0ABU8XPC4_9PROT